MQKKYESNNILHITFLTIKGKNYEKNVNAYLFVGFAQAAEQACEKSCEKMTRAKFVAEAKVVGADFGKGMLAGIGSQFIVELATSGLYKGLKKFEHQDAKSSFYAKTGICGDQVKGFATAGLSILGLNVIGKQQNFNTANYFGAFTGAILTRATWAFIAGKIKNHYEKVKEAK